jgi:ferredoxin-NADP reductase
VPESIWTSRPPDLYGRRDRDRLATALWGVRVLFGGFASASRWKPSRVRPVRRMQSAVVTNRELVAPDVVSLTLADPDGGLLPSWTPGAHIDVALPSVGGGTPILPMIRLAQQREIDWRAIYAGRSREYMPFLDEVVSVAPDRVTVWADDEHGRFATVDDLLAGARPATAVYVCGPTEMLEAVRVARNEHANAPLHYERFSPPPVVDGIPFELQLARSKLLLSVPANRSALDVMLDQDPTTAYSCQQGYCGTCKVKVLAGQVDHRSRAVVSDDEMLVCVSRAKDDRLVIDA